jgi:hypothetical protein
MDVSIKQMPYLLSPPQLSSKPWEKIIQHSDKEHKGQNKRYKKI